TEHALQGLSRIRMRVKRNLVRVAEAQRTNIIKPQHVVGVGVSIEDGIQPLHPFANGLLAKIRRGIDEHASLCILEHDRGPGAAVAGIIGRTHAALAADGRDTHGRATAQHREDSLHLPFPPGVTIPGSGRGALAMALVISIQAMRNSNKTFCKRVCSRSVRLPLVFSCRMSSESMVCRAPRIST